jgi:hypothetical protein
VFSVVALLLVLLAWWLVRQSSLASNRLVRVGAPVALAVSAATWLLVSGCGGGPAPPTNATLTITGTSNGVTRTEPVSITVNH